MLTILIVVGSLFALYMLGFVITLVRKSGSIFEKIISGLFWPLVWGVALIGALFGKWKLNK